MSIIPPYIAREMAVLVPTKDRPGHVHRLLESLERQVAGAGQIIVVDGGESVEDVVRSFEGRLPVEWHPCLPPGQIRQRKLGLKKLAPYIRLVSLFDDDMVLDPYAIQKMISMWNSVEPETAGIGYNLVNCPKHIYRKHYAAFFMSSPRAGEVLTSGFVTPLGNIDSNIQVQWLGGGYTSWRRSIVTEIAQEEISTRWAVGEDVRFSYPIGKNQPLYVCASAKVQEENLGDYALPENLAGYQGRKWALAQLYLVSQHKELSTWRCLWMIFGSTLLKFGVGLLRNNKTARKAAYGQFGALLIYLRTRLANNSIKTLLED